MKLAFRISRILAPFAIGVIAGVKVFARGDLIDIWGCCLFAGLALALIFEVTYAE